MDQNQYKALIDKAISLVRQELEEIDNDSMTETFRSIAGSIQEEILKKFQNTKYQDKVKEIFSMNFEILVEYFSDCMQLTKDKKQSAINQLQSAMGKFARELPTDAVLNVGSFIYDDKFVCLLNSLSTALREYFGNTKGKYYLIKSLCNGIQEGLNSCKTSLQECIYTNAIKYNTGAGNREQSQNKELSLKAVEQSLGSIYDARAKISKSVKELDTVRSKLFEDANSVLRDIKALRLSRLEDLTEHAEYFISPKNQFNWLLCSSELDSEEIRKFPRVNNYTFGSEMKEGKKIEITTLSPCDSNRMKENPVNNKPESLHSQYHSRVKDLLNEVKELKFANIRLKAENLKLKDSYSRTDPERRAQKFCSQSMSPGQGKKDHKSTYTEGFNKNWNSQERHSQSGENFNASLSKKLKVDLSKKKLLGNIHIKSNLSKIPDGKASRNIINRLKEAIYSSSKSKNKKLCRSNRQTDPEIEKFPQSVLDFMELMTTLQENIARKSSRVQELKREFETRKSSIAASARRVLQCRGEPRNFPSTTSNSTLKSAANALANRSFGSFDSLGHPKESLRKTFKTASCKEDGLKVGFKPFVKVAIPKNPKMCRHSDENLSGVYSNPLGFCNLVLCKNESLLFKGDSDGAAQVKSLLAKIDSYKSQISALIKSEESKSAEIRLLEADKEALDSQISYLNKENEGLSTKLAKLSRQDYIDSKVKESPLYTELQKSFEKLKSSLNTKESANKSLDKAISRLLSVQLTQLEQNVKVFEALDASRNKTVEKLEVLLESMQSDLDGKPQEVLEHLLSEAVQEKVRYLLRQCLHCAGSLSERLVEQEAAVKELQAKVARLGGQGSFENMLEEAQNRNVELLIEQKGLKQEISAGKAAREKLAEELLNTKEALNRALTETEQELQEANARNEKLRRDFKAQEARALELEEAFDRLTEKNKSLSLSNTELLERLESQGDKIAEVKELQDLVNKQKEELKQIDYLKSSYSSRIKDIENTNKAAIAENSKELYDLRLSLIELSTSLSNNAQKTQQEEKSIKALLEQIKTELKAKLNELNTLSTTNKELKEATSKTVHLNQALESQNKAMESKIKELESKARLLEEDAEQLRLKAISQKENFDLVHLREVSKVKAEFTQKLKEVQSSGISNHKKELKELSDYYESRLEECRGKLARDEQNQSALNELREMLSQKDLEIQALHREKESKNKPISQDEELKLVLEQKEQIFKSSDKITSVEKPEQTGLDKAKQISDLEHEISNLKAQINTLTNSAQQTLSNHSEETQQQMSQMKEEIHKLKKSKETLQAKNKELERENGDLLESITKSFSTKHQDDLMQNQHKIQLLSAELEESQKALEDQQALTKQLEQVLEERDKETKALKEENKVVKDKLSELKADFNRSIESLHRGDGVTRLEEQVESLQREKNDLIHSYSNIVQERGNAENRLKQVTSKCADLDKILLEARQMPRRSVCAFEEELELMAKGNRDLSGISVYMEGFIEKATRRIRSYKETPKALLNQVSPRTHDILTEKAVTIGRNSLVWLLLCEKNVDSSGFTYGNTLWVSLESIGGEKSLREYNKSNTYEYIADYPSRDTKGNKSISIDRNKELSGLRDHNEELKAKLRDLEASLETEIKKRKIIEEAKKPNEAVSTQFN